MKIARIVLSTALGISLFFSTSAVSQMTSIQTSDDTTTVVQNKIEQNQTLQAQTEDGTLGVKVNDSFAELIYDDSVMMSSSATSKEAQDYQSEDSEELLQHNPAVSYLEDTDYLPSKLDINKQRAYSEAEKLLIARVVYAESRGELFEGQVAVATVVLNRYESGLYGNSIKTIVFAPYQFAITAKHNNSAMRAVEAALDARDAYPYNMFYFRVSKSKKWRNFVYYKRIGNHSFYLAAE